MKRPELLDAVTLKEIFGISRRGQTYFGRVVYVGLIGLIMYQFWSSIITSTPFLSPLTGEGGRGVKGGPALSGSEGCQF